MLAQVLTAVVVVAFPMVTGFVAGILKDGSPLHRDWWTA